MSERSNSSQLNTKSEKRKQYWFVIKELTGREIKRRYARSKLGIVWSVLQPLLVMIVVSAVFSYLFRRQIVDFPVYYLCGYVLWSLFTNSTNSAMTSLVDNKLMLIKVKFPMNIFVYSRIYTAFVNFLYSMISFAVMYAVFCFINIDELNLHPLQPSLYLFWMLPAVFLMLVLSIGVSNILATLYSFFGDIKHLYTVLTTLLMYLSAIFYPLSSLPDFMQTIISFNPLYMSFDIMRCAVLYNTNPGLRSLLGLVIWAFAFYFIGRAYFNKNRNRIIQKL